MCEVDVRQGVPPRNQGGRGVSGEKNYFFDGWFFVLI